MQCCANRYAGRDDLRRSARNLERIKSINVPVQRSLETDDLSRVNRSPTNSADDPARFPMTAANGSAASHIEGRKGQFPSGDGR